MVIDSVSASSTRALCVVLTAKHSKTASVRRCAVRRKKLEKLEKLKELKKLNALHVALESIAVGVGDTNYLVANIYT